MILLTSSPYIQPEPALESFSIGLAALSIEMAKVENQ
jgi:hypothetical protein